MPIVERAQLRDKARFVVALHQWSVEPDFDRDGDGVLLL
jgi:hypothetical protein